LSEAKAEGWFWNWFKMGWEPVLRTVPIPVETILVVWDIPSLETEGSVDAMKDLVNHETGNTKGCDSETSTGRSDPRRRDRPE
jgi:hypothetical protein